MKNIFAPYKEFWDKYRDFSGTTSRADFWLTIWVHLIIYLLIFAYVLTYKQKYGAIFGIFCLVLYTGLTIYPLLTLQTRRYHDLGISGKWLWLTFVIPSVALITCVVAHTMAVWLGWVAVVLLLIDVILLILPGQHK